MNIKMASAWGALLLSGVFSAGAWADVLLKDKSEIVGKWTLESVAAGINKPKIEEKRTWEFRADGVVVTSGYNRHLKQDDTREVKYEIVDGKIRTDDLGRPGKSVDYAIHDKTGNTMVLRGGIEGFYFFKRQ